MIKISLPNDQRAKLRKALNRAGSREIGGILMGEQIAPDLFRIMEFSLDSTTGSAAHFVRNPAQHTAILEDFFRRTGSDFSRFNYLGEWHSHPRFPVRPSLEDIQSMQSLVNGERGIEFAALMIVRLRYRLVFEAGAYMFVRGASPTTVRLSS